MVVWRRWIFPILMLAACAAIAVALVKLAFFPDTEQTVAAPSAHVADTVVPVEKADLVNELSLPGTVARDEGFAVRSEVDGIVTRVDVSDGQTVAAGQTLFTIKQTDPAKTVLVKASEAGDVSKIAVVKGQPASVGLELATLTPARYHVLGTVQPVQLYRLIGAPSEASVTITGGPAPFTCTGVRVQVADDGTTSVRCAVPGDQTVFPGLQAQVGIKVGTVTGALVVPTTAVKGGSGTGVVWADDGKGGLTEKKVTLGVSDGERVEVKEGLAEGDSIRQFVPGSSADDKPACHDDGNGGQYCEQAGWSW